MGDGKAINIIGLKLGKQQRFFGLWERTPTYEDTNWIKRKSREKEPQNHRVRDCLGFEENSGDHLTQTPIILIVRMIRNVPRLWTLILI